MRVGSLFSGYGGLDLAVGGELAWYAEIEPAACQVLAHHYPSVPNLGDIRQINWAKVPSVDVITGGYPCQPFSTAGHRKGANDDRHLWPYVRNAICTMGPKFTILENVRGHLTLGFSDVLADLANDGFNAEWAVVPAATIGAPHRRERLFIVAYPSSAKRGNTQHEHLGATCWPTTESGECSGVDWRQYKPAIQRWEHTLGRPAPHPTIMGPTGRPRLNPVFVEWMMGLPQGWVTGHGLSAAKCLKMLGNGVVPQQAHYAITQLFARIS